MAQYGSCKWITDDGDHSYRPEPALVPVEIFEDTNVVYIAPEYYYELSEETCNDGRCYRAECTKVTNTLPLLQDSEDTYHQMWRFLVIAHILPRRHREHGESLRTVSCSVFSVPPW